MVTVKDIYNTLNIIAPITEGICYDNEGLLAGDFDSQVTKTLISLDATPEVCEEAWEIGANLIVTHHPVIYKPLRALQLESAVHKLMKYDINLLAMHTSLDVSLKGVNFQLANKLDLEKPDGFSYKSDAPIGVIGELKNEMNSKEFAEFVCKKLDCHGLRYTERQGNIKKVAVCGGAGGFLVRDAVLAGADVLVTGEIKHSDILVANAHNLSVIDAGHYKTENMIVPFLRDFLQEWFPDEEFVVTKVFDDRVKYLCE